jgi:hypothetical protein
VASADFDYFCQQRLQNVTGNATWWKDVKFLNEKNISGSLQFDDVRDG